MKACLYAAAVHGRLNWRLSIHFDTDCIYWFEQLGGKASLHLLEPVLSLGEAASLLECLNDTKSEFTVAEVNSGKTMRLLTNICGQLGIGQALRLRKVTYAEYMAEASAGRVPLDERELYELERLLAGRCLSRDELTQFIERHGLAKARSAWTSYVQAAALRGRAELRNGVERFRKRGMWPPRLKSSDKHSYRCRRCGMGEDRMHRSDCAHCSEACMYCEECLTMGKMQSCSLLVYGVQPKGEGEGSTVQDYVGATVTGDASPFIEKWGLSPAQTEAAERGLEFMRKDRNMRVGAAADNRFLIWAVTGAGKTEMIFPFIDYELHRGGKVVLATPRRDVVLELQPRLQKAFPDRTIVTLYGGSEQRWDPGDITLSTTHQLLRFSRQFDLVIIDELDAFPYHNNPSLQYAARNVCRAGGIYMLLSATPPAELRSAARRGNLEHVKVPVRFHRHPLPIPRMLASKPIKKGSGASLPAKAEEELQRSLERGAQLFVFVSRIRDVEPYVSLLRRRFPGHRVEGTSSKDPDRAQKVVDFRQRQTRILVTTTILERGVTVPKTDVFIVDADSSTFDDAALIQMAGRAGRSKDDPHGRVFFISTARTNSQIGAIRQIREMNRLAKRKGYLAEPYLRKRWGWTIRKQKSKAGEENHEN